MIVSFLAGFLVGSLPTARLLAGRAGVDLTAGSGNPGANNARRLGGWKLAATILLVEMAKAAGVVAAAMALSSDSAGVAAGIGAVAGNVYNPWLQLKGGQGLGATAGVLLAAWPAGLAIGVAAIAAGTKLMRSTYRATLVTFVLLVACAAAGIGSPWGLVDGQLWLMVGLSALVGPKQVGLIRRASHPGSRG